ncbi:MAG: MFS transporter, partial [Pseudomonadota bacterium]
MFRVREGNRKWWVLAAMGAGGGLIMLDETVVGIALPTIQHDLKMADVTSHWVVNAYMLVFAAFAAASGKLGDLFGFRALLICGSVLFGMASLACGLSGSGAWLVTARLVQGLGAAAIFPATVAMVMIAFPEEQRGMAMGVLAAVGTTFLAIGPLVGGLLTELVSWRWIFWINVPVVTA